MIIIYTWSSSVLVTLMRSLCQGLRIRIRSSTTGILIPRSLPKSPPMHNRHKFMHTAIERTINSCTQQLSIDTIYFQNHTSGQMIYLVVYTVFGIGYLCHKQHVATPTCSNGYKRRCINVQLSINGYRPYSYKSS